MVKAQGQAEVEISTAMQDLRQADMVLTVTNAIEAVIEPQHLKSGVVVCDVARPRDVSRQVIEARNDVLVIEGNPLEDLNGNGIPEFFAPPMGDLELGRGIVLVRNGKGGRDRYVPIGARASSWIERYLREVRPLQIRHRQRS